MSGSNHKAGLADATPASDARNTPTAELPTPTPTPAPGHAEQTHTTPPTPLPWRGGEGDGSGRAAGSGTSGSAGSFGTNGQAKSKVSFDADGAPQIPDYDIQGPLGEGGMGVVWRAVQLSTRRPVALKLLHASAFGSERAKTRFEREVELAARLEHPNIARVYDSGLHRGIHFYAMELVEGHHLDVHVSMKGLDKRGILGLMKTVCEAVQHAHQRGVIHRDLKPSNILVTKDGKPYIVDFGLAKTVLGDAKHNVSVEGQVAGTPAYMSPEQAAGKVSQIDTRSDVYSLGVILYKLLTGRSPHDLSGPGFDVLKRIADGDVRSPRTVDKDASRVVDRELEALLLKALAKEPGRRYATAAELAQDIDNYLRGEPLLAKPPTVTYVLRRRLHKHRVAASITTGALLTLAAAGSATAAYFYNLPVVLPIDSNPMGATIYLDGERQNGCGVTPCNVKLTPGEHVIELRHQGDFEPARRRITVAWGRVTGDAYEPITLQPRFRTVVFNAEPGDVTFVLRRLDDTGHYTVRPPQTHSIPVGRYEVDLGEAESQYTLDPNYRILEFAPGLEVIPLTLKLEPRPR